MKPRAITVGVSDLTGQPIVFTITSKPPKRGRRKRAKGRKQ